MFFRYDSFSMQRPPLFSPPAPVVLRSAEPATRNQSLVVEGPGGGSGALWSRSTTHQLLHSHPSLCLASHILFMELVSAPLCAYASSSVRSMSCQTSMTTCTPTYHPGGWMSLSILRFPPPLSSPFRVPTFRVVTQVYNLTVTT